MNTVAKKPSPLSRPPLERMLRIHQALQAGNFPNATALARDIEVFAAAIVELRANPTELVEDDGSGLNGGAR